MKSREIFKIIVATLGLIGVLYGILYIIDGLLFTLGLFELQHSSPKYYVAKGVIEIFVGVLVMKGFPPFVDLAFPEDEENKTDKDNENNEKK